MELERELIAPMGFADFGEGSERVGEGVGVDRERGNAMDRRSHQMKRKLLSRIGCGPHFVGCWREGAVNQSCDPPRDQKQRSAWVGKSYTSRKREELPDNNRAHTEDVGIETVIQNFEKRSGAPQQQRCEKKKQWFR